MATIILRHGFRKLSNRAVSGVLVRQVGDIGRKSNYLSSAAVTSTMTVRHKSSKKKKGQSADNGDKKDVSSIVQPIAITPHTDPDGINVGEELAGKLKKEDLLKLLNNFYKRKEIVELASEEGLDDKLFHQAYVSFRRFCIESESLPADLHICLSDIINSAGHTTDVFPYFMQHAKVMFPHLECMDDLVKISDLRHPANWYPEARAIQRKIIFHAGPTNSGKTYHALQRFMEADTAVYCGPLRLLANEVFHKSNNLGHPCDLVTGEERRLVREDGEPCGHVACTVEMTSVNNPYDVAVVDEIQMMRDPQRGWAWTRALLGICAKEIHVCGEASAIDLVQDLAITCGDEFEVRKYKRLTPLTVLNKSVDKFENIRPGDCLVCFSKNDIYYLSRQLEQRSTQVAVIYGGLPPGTKIAQANKFNDPSDPCKVMVSTDAIGMGLNLNIKRVIFYSVMKPTLNSEGEMEVDVISPSSALQIAGRAGRFNTEYAHGEVTTYKSQDLPVLKQLLKTPVETVERAGLHPTAEQIELFAYHLPKATLSNLIDIFVNLSQVDSKRFFICNVDDFKFLADTIEHVPLQLRVRYVFCCAPIPKKQPFVCTLFLKFARRFSRGEGITMEWLCRQVGWPLAQPATISDLVHLENVFDVFDLYLWLSYRFPDMFPDTDHIRELQTELDALIQSGVFNITRLLRNSQNTPSSELSDETDNVLIKRQQARSMDKSKEPEKISLLERLKLAKKVDKIDPQKNVAEQLVKKGLLTKDIIKRLREEWENEKKEDS